MNSITTTNILLIVLLVIVAVTTIWDFCYKRAEAEQPEDKETVNFLGARTLALKKRNK